VVTPTTTKNAYKPACTYKCLKHISGSDRHKGPTLIKAQGKIISKSLTRTQNCKN
jgi:hypothetical protein